MDIKALQLASRFALTPNSLGYCGKDTAPDKFKKCITSNNCKGVQEEISEFIVLYPYLKTISQIIGHPVYSYPVIESYWIGNDQLKKVQTQHYKKLLENFEKTGVPKSLIEELRKNQPKTFIPHHLFQVLHIGVGRASGGTVPFNINSINNCMVRWGKVKKITKDQVVVNLNSLNKGYELEFIEIALSYAGFVAKPKIGDAVAVHWKQMVKILSKDEEENLYFWTNEVIKALA